MVNKKVNFKNPDSPASWGQINLASFNLNALSENADGKKTYHSMREVIKFLVFDRATFEETSTYEVKNNCLTMAKIQKLIEALKVPATIEKEFKVEIKRKRPITKKAKPARVSLSAEDALKALGISVDDLKKLKAGIGKSKKTTPKKRI